MSSRYEQEDFELEDEEITEKSTMRKAHSKLQNSSDVYHEDIKKQKHVKSHTLDVDSRFSTSNQSKKLKSVSVYDNHSGPSLPKIKKELNLALLNRRVTQSRDSNSAGKSGQQFNQLNIGKTLKSFSKNTQRRSSKMSHQRNTKTIAVQSTLKSKHKKLQLSIITKSESSKVSDYFCHSKEQLSNLSNDDLIRLTNKIKLWIKKLDKDLEDKIYKAIKQRQSKSIQHEDRQDKLINLLKAHLNNNAGVLQGMQKEQSKLYSKEGEFKQEEYELMLDKEANSLIEMIKNEKRYIIKLRKIVKLDENRIDEKMDNSKILKKFDSLRGEIIQNRKEQLHNIKIFDRVQSSLSQIQKLTQTVALKHQELLDEAKAKNISLQVNNYEQKYHELKFKIEKLRIIKGNSENVTNRGIASLNNEIRHLTNEIRQYNEDIKHNEKKVTLLAQQTQEFMKFHRAKLTKNGFFVTGQPNFNRSKIVHQNITGNIIKPFPKSSLEKQNQAQVKRQLKEIKESDEVHTNLLEPQFENEFLNESNEFMSLSKKNANEQIEQQKNQKANIPIETIENKLALSSSAKEEEKIEQPINQSGSSAIFPKRIQLRKDRSKGEKNNKLQLII